MVSVMNDFVCLKSVGNVFDSEQVHGTLDPFDDDESDGCPPLTPRSVPLPLCSPRRSFLRPLFLYSQDPIPITSSKVSVDIPTGSAADEAAPDAKNKKKKPKPESNFFLLKLPCNSLFRTFSPDVYLGQTTPPKKSPARLPLRLPNPRYLPRRSIPFPYPSSFPAPRSPLALLC